MDPASSTQPQKSYPCNSPENPRRSTPLSINVEQPIKVKLALLALSEADFNPTGQGRVDIGQDGFKITVWNPRTLVVGNLRLHAQADHDFLGGTSFSPKKIDLKSLVEVFDAPRDDEDVTVSVVHGSDKLSFTFGRSDQPTKILVDLSELSAEFRKSPVITAPCGAIMASQYLRETMIPDILFQQGTAQDVTVKMTENSMNMTLGDREWHSEIGLTRGWKPEEGFSRTLKF